MFCANCGKKLIDGSMFCMDCGAPIPIGRFSQPSASPNFSGAQSSDIAENSYNAPNEADLFGTNSFSEEAVSAFSGAMNAFGVQGFQVPTIEDVDLSAGKIRQKAPKNKGDNIRVENFSMTDGEKTEIISNDIPIIEGCSMDEDESKDVILDPYRFLGNSMEDVSMDMESDEMSDEKTEPVTVEPVSFSPDAPPENFAALSAEPDVQPAVTVEPVVLPWMQNNAAETVTEQAVEPVAEQAVEPVVEQVTETVAEQAAEPVVEQAVETVAEQAVEPVAEQKAEPVTEQAVEPVITEQPVVPQAPETPQPAKYIPPISEPPVIEEQPPQDSYQPPVPQKKGVPVWLFILVIAVLIAIILIIFFMNK